MSASVAAALSDRVIACDGHDTGVAPSIAAAEFRATHAAILERGRLRELVRLSPSGSVSSRALPVNGQRVRVLKVSPEASLESIGRELLSGEYEAVAVTGEDDRYLGTITPTSLLESLLEEHAAQRQAAEALRRGRDELERLVQQRTIELRRANRILQAEISDRLQAEEALRRSELLLRSVVENVPAIIARLNTDGTFAFVNSTVPGLSREQVLGRHITEFVPPERREDMQAMLDEVLTTGVTNDYEFPGQGANGKTAVYSCRMARLNEEGRTVGLITVATDVTEARCAAEALLESERRLRLVVSNAPVILFSLDRQGRVTLAEGRELQALGLVPAEAIGQSAFDMFREDPDVIQAVHRALAGEEFTAIHEGRGLVFECRYSPLYDARGSLSGVIGVATNITERRKAEAQVRQYADIVENIELGLYVQRLERVGGALSLRCVSMNPAAEQLTGVRSDEFVGRTVEEVYPRLRSTGIVDIAERVLRTGIPEEIDHFWYGDDRVPYSAWELTIFPLPNQCVGVAFQNVTERRRAAEALHASEDLKRLILQSVPAGIVQVDRDGRIVSANPQATEFLGLTHDELTQRFVADFETTCFREDGTLCPVEDFPVSRCLRTGEPQPPVTLGVGSPAGGIRWALFSAEPLREPGQRQCTGAVVTFLDITERKQTEEHARSLQNDLAHVARLSTMGEMASGLAHELNQPLAAIIAYADACQELVESGRIVREQLVEVLRAVSHQAERAGKIIHRLRQLVKKSEPVRLPVNVNDAVREVAALLESEARSARAHVRLELDETLPSVPADFVQIQQVLLNLMRNGIESMIDNDGYPRDVTVTTRPESGHRVEVAVRDRGRGLTPETAGRLFEPFFTTKSEGLGMGLPISRSIVEAHGGKMSFSPNADRGLTIRFVLPAALDGDTP